MKIMVTGGRHYRGVAQVNQELDFELANATEPMLLIVGDAAGADELAREWAMANPSVMLRVHRAEWRKLGAKAGPVRNQAMVDEKPDLCIAFPGGKGTADAVARCIKAGIPVRKA